MDNPASDIAFAISRILNASTPDLQISAIKQYFTSDASLSHPLCYIPSTPDSRERIIRAYFFLHIVAPACTAKIRRQSFNELKGKMSLEMEITSSLRGLDILDKILQRPLPTVPVHVFLTLKRDLIVTGPWKIARQEIIVQPIDFLDGIGLPWIGHIIYYILWLALLSVVFMGQILRIWPTKDFSIIYESIAAIKDGINLLVFTPIAAVMGDVAQTKMIVKGVIREVTVRSAGRIAVARLAWRWLAWKAVEPALQVKLPTLEMPEFQMPNVELPNVEMKEVTVKVPSVNVPKVQVPPVQLPSVSVAKDLILGG